MNNMLVQRSIEFYHKCWLYRNEIFHSPVKQYKLLEQWSNVIKIKAQDIGGNAASYTRQHPLKEVNINNINYTKDQIINMQSFIKNHKSYDIEDIRKYIRRGTKIKGKRK